MQNNGKQQMLMLELESYQAQQARWPANGRHILAQFDEETVIVYQAYRPSLLKKSVGIGLYKIGV